MGVLTNIKKYLLNQLADNGIIITALHSIQMGPQDTIHYLKIFK